jgi:hypothetical protein
LAPDAAEAQRISEEGRIERFGWKHVFRPEHLIGWERPRIVLSDNARTMPGFPLFMVEADARSAIIFTEFDLYRGRVK